MSGKNDSALAGLREELGGAREELGSGVLRKIKEHLLLQRRLVGEERYCLAGLGASGEVEGRGQVTRLL